MRSGMLLLLHDPRRNQVAPIFKKQYIKTLYAFILIHLMIFLNTYLALNATRPPSRLLTRGSTKALALMLYQNLIFPLNIPMS